MVAVALLAAPGLARAGPLAASGSVPPPSNTSPPVISGTAQDGQSLSATTGSWTTGAPPLKFLYQWERCTSTGGSCTPISAKASSYTLTSTDVGHQLTVVVKGTDELRQTTPATATAAGPVLAPPPPADTTLPKISGVAQDGHTLTASTGSWSSPDMLRYKYQWQRCGSTGASCVNISKATGASYAASAADVGHELTIVVSATDRESHTAAGKASPVGPVAPPPPPSLTALPRVSGTARDGSTLMTTTGSWSSPDALGYRYQWQRCDGTGAACVGIVGATSASYGITGYDIGHEITSLVTAVDGEGQTGQGDGTPVGPVASPSPPSTSVLPSIAGIAQVGQTLLVSDGSWVTPDVLTYTYQWERCDSSGGNCAPLPDQATGAYVLTTDDLGRDITVVVTATDVANQSAQATAEPIGPVAAQQPATGIQKIQHVVIIMQENRSFDSYFGTYPGADGIPAGVCLPDPVNGGCLTPYHDVADANQGGLMASRTRPVTSMQARWTGSSARSSSS